jgi:hypothetical protein
MNFRRAVELREPMHPPFVNYYAEEVPMLAPLEIPADVANLDPDSLVRAGRLLSHETISALDRVRKIATCVTANAESLHQRALLIRMEQRKTKEEWVLSKRRRRELNMAVLLQANLVSEGWNSLIRELQLCGENLERRGEPITVLSSADRKRLQDRFLSTSEEEEEDDDVATLFTDDELPEEEQNAPNDSTDDILTQSHTRHCTPTISVGAFEEEEKRADADDKAERFIRMVAEQMSQSHTTPPVLTQSLIMTDDDEEEPSLITQLPDKEEDDDIDNDNGNLSEEI